MRRSKSFSITWSPRNLKGQLAQSPVQFDLRSYASQPRAAALHLKSFSPCLPASVVGFLLLLPLLALAQAPQPAADLSHSPGWVVIPIDQYEKLHAQAYPSEHDPEPPPVDATLSRVDYDLNIAGELATGHASLTIDVLKDGGGRVHIPSRL